MPKFKNNDHCNENKHDFNNLRYACVFSVTYGHDKCQTTASHIRGGKTRSQTFSRSKPPLIRIRTSSKGNVIEMLYDKE